jgi:hypothetical protein
MNITTAGFDMTRSLQDMGDLLKTIAAQTTGLQDKLLRASVIEKVGDPDLGKILDMEA